MYYHKGANGEGGRGKGAGVRGAMRIKEGERMQRSATDFDATGEDEDDS